MTTSSLAQAGPGPSPPPTLQPFGSPPSANPSPSIPILLLKTRSYPNDSYEAYFTTASPPFASYFVPVLHHTYSAPVLAKVRTLLLSPSILGEQYGGLIFTSQRAVEAFGSVLGTLTTERSPPDTDLGAVRSSGTEQASLISGLKALALPLYTVGPATSRALSALQSTYLPGCSIHGQDIGNGENLAKFILSHYSNVSSSQRHSVDKKNTTLLPLLFLVGETRRDIIPRTLSAHSIHVDEWPVYETTIQESFPTVFGAVLEETKEARAVWVVVFSPAGCESMLRVLGMLDEGTGRVRVVEKGGHWYDGKTVDIASIGPTTRDYLSNEFGCEVDVCAERPSPEGLGEGIVEFMREKGFV